MQNVLLLRYIATCKQWLNKYLSSLLFNINEGAILKFNYALQNSIIYVLSTVHS